MQFEGSEMSGQPPEACKLEDVLNAERKTIAAIRKLRDTNCPSGTTFRRPSNRPPDEPPKKPNLCGKPENDSDWKKSDDAWPEAIRNAHDADHVGLALSGGGIRSATFNLGVLQALAELRLLNRIDYLSTVSGGGYLGAWLAAWTKRAKKGFAEVQNRLATNRVLQPNDKEPPEIRFLRVFSNYLTPSVGVFSGDTWTMVAIYLRNTLLNLVIVLAMVAGLLTVPRWAVRTAVWVSMAPGGGWVW